MGVLRKQVVASVDRDSKIKSNDSDGRSMHCIRTYINVDHHH